MGNGTQLANGQSPSGTGTNTTLAPTQGQGSNPVGGTIGGGTSPSDVEKTRQHQADVKMVMDVFKRNPDAVADALIQIYKDPSSAAIMDKALGRNGIPSGSFGAGAPNTTTYTNQYQFTNGGGGASQGQSQGFTYLNPQAQVLMAQAQIAAIGSVAMDPSTPQDKKQIAQGFVEWNTKRGPDAPINAEVISRAGATVAELGIVMGGIPGYTPSASTYTQGSNNSGTQQQSPQNSRAFDPADLYTRLIKSGMDPDQAANIVARASGAEGQRTNSSSRGWDQTNQRTTLMDKQTEERIELMKAQDDIQARKENRKFQRTMWTTLGAIFIPKFLRF